MERDIILNKTKELPRVMVGTAHQEGDVWEGQEEGAHFTFSVDFIVDDNRRKKIFYSLSVSGKKGGKEKLIEDFTDALGEPANHYKNPLNPNIDHVAWLPGRKKRK